MRIANAVRLIFFLLFLILISSFVMAGCHIGNVGEAYYCSDFCRCSEGEGDCDNDSECQRWWVCADNVGRTYGFGSAVDVCEPASGCHIGSLGSDGYCSSSCKCDVGEGLCSGDDECMSGLQCNMRICEPAPSCRPGSLGHPDYCSGTCKCDVGEGDCDRDSHCETGLVCQHGVGDRYGFHSSTSVCVFPEDPIGSTSCHVGSLGNEDYCSDWCRCDAGEGDCDYDLECDSGLICSDNVGASYGFSSTTDVCEVPAPTCHVGGLGMDSYCSSDCLCDSGEGDCDGDSQCSAGLVCMGNVGDSFGWSPDTDVCLPPDHPLCHAGSFNGTEHYCSSECRCDIGEGDCDSDFECRAGLTCLDNVGASYGLGSDIDVCDTAPACSSNSDCGSNGYTGSMFCSGGNVYQSYRTYTCNNPRTPSASCSSSVSDRLVDDCSGNGCSGGVCNSAPSSCHSGSLGGFSYCSSSCPCSAGEGDCDNDSHCVSGLTCVDDVGASYGWSSSVDVCESSGSTPSDCHSGSLGGWTYCSDSCPCDVGEGDCDRDSQCNSGLICADDVGPSYGWPVGLDVCESSGGGSPSDCHSGSVGHVSYCSASCPCDVGEGDCDGDVQCNAGLTCAQNVGASYGWSSTVDVCEADTFVAVPLGHENYCRAKGICDLGEGNCDSHYQCRGSLICVEGVGQAFGFSSDTGICMKPVTDVSVIAATGVAIAGDPFVRTLSKRYTLTAYGDPNGHFIPGLSTSCADSDLDKPVPHFNVVIYDMGSEVFNLHIGKYVKVDGTQCSFAYESRSRVCQKNCGSPRNPRELIRNPPVPYPTTIPADVMDQVLRELGISPSTGGWPVNFPVLVSTLAISGAVAITVYSVWCILTSPLGACA